MVHAKARDGSAKLNQHYFFRAGTYTIPAGQIKPRSPIEVNIYPSFPWNPSSGKTFELVLSIPSSHSEQQAVIGDGVGLGTIGD